MKPKYCLVRLRASRRSFIPCVLASALAFLLGGHQSNAQTRTWAGATANVASGAWGTTTNWSGSDIPDTNLEIASLSADWTGSGPTFALGANRTVNGLIYNDTGTTTDQAGSIVVGSTLTLDGTSPTITTTNSLTISATMGWGAAGFTKNGSTTLTLSAGNTGTGPVSLSAGTIRATNNAAALGTGAATISLAASTVLQLANDSALNYARNTTITGNASITSDRLSAGAAVTHTLGTLSIGAQTLSITRGASASSGNGGITFGATTLSAGPAVFDTGANTNLTLGAVGGAFALTKQGAGQLTLGTTSARTTAAGITNLSAGTLRLNTANALNTLATAPLNISGGTLSLAVTAGATYGGTATTVSANATIEADAQASTANVTQTLGTLSIGAQTLSVSRGANITGTGSVTFGATTMTGNATFSPGSNTQLTLGAVGGAFTLTKTGGGIAVLSAAGTYTGATTVSAGTLRAGNATAFGTTAGGVSVTSGAVVDLNGVAVGAEAFTLNGTGISSGGALINSSSAAASLSGTINLASNSSIGGNGAGLFTLSGIISGSGTLTKVGTGTVLLTGANTFANGVTVEEGALRIQTSASAAGAGTIFIGATTGAASATLQAGSSLTHTNTITVQAGSSGTKTLSLIAAPTTIFSGLITMNDNLTVSNTGTGVLQTGVVNTSGNSINLNANTLTIANTNTGRYFSDGVIYGTGSVVMNSSGTGDWVPRGDHTYSGGTTVTAGVIAVDRDSIGTPGSPTSGAFGTGTLVINGGQMRAGTTADRTVGNAVTLSGNTTFYTTASEKSLIFSGPVTLSGASRTITSTLGTTVAGKSAVFSGAIGDGGNVLGLVKAGAGNLTLAGTNTYTGGTTVSEGTLILSGSVASNTAFSLAPTVAEGATLSLASGTANAVANISALTLGSATGTSRLALELGAGTETSDKLSSPNAATTTGTVSINILALPGFGAASTYDLITAASGLSGATYSLVNAPGGYSYTLNATDTAVQLGFTPVTGDIYWRGNSNNSWSSLAAGTSNWFTDSAGTTNAQASPGAGSTVRFSTVNATNTVGVITTTLDQNYTVNNLVFGNNPNGVTSVTIAGGTTPALATGVLTIAPASSVDGISVGSNAGSVTVSAPVVLGSNQTWSVDGTGANGSALTVTGALSGSSSLDISGLVTLSAAAATSTHSGTITVLNGGILQGGVANSFSSTSTVQLNASGTLRLNGFSNTIGSLTGSGTVQNNHASTAATLSVGDASNFTFGGLLQNGAAATLALTKVGAGTMTLTTAHSYTGGTTISAGTLQQGIENALPTGRALTVNGTSIFDLNGLNASVSTLGGVATGVVTDNAAGSGTSTLSITNAGSSAVNIKDGVSRDLALRVTNANGNFSLANAANTFSGGIVLTTSGAGTRLSPGTITAGSYGTGAITIGESPTDLAGIYFATSNQTLSNPITFNTALGTDRVGIRTDAAGIVLSGVITANLAPATFTSNTATAGAFTLTNQVTGSSGLVLDIVSLSASATQFIVTLNNAAGTNNYQGDTVVNFNAASGKSATLQLLAAGQIPNGAGTGNVIVNSNSTGIGLLSLAGGNETINGLSGSGNVAIPSGTVTLTLGDNDATASHSGAINNTAGILSLTKIGTGTQTLSGASNFAGALSVNGGLVAFPSSPATSGPLGNSTVVNLNGGGISYTSSSATALNRPVSVGASAGTVDVANASGSLSFAVSSSGGNLVKTGPGTAVISGTTSLNGGLAGVVVDAGTLRAGFGGTDIATVSVGSTGNLNLADSTVSAEALTLDNSVGALTLAGGAQLGFEFNGATTDSIAVGSSGTAVTSGVVTLNFSGTPAAGTYNLLTAPSGLSGATYALGTAPNGFNYTINASDTVVSVTVSASVPIYWRGGQDLSWNTLGSGTANWTTDSAGTVDALSKPVGADTVYFAATGAPFTSGSVIDTTLDAAFTVDSLQFTNIPTGVTAVSIAAGTGGSLTLTPASTSGGIRVLTGGGNATISAPLTVGAAQTWDIDPTGSLTVSGDTAFNANVVKSNTGALTLSGNNTGSGSLTLSGGTLNINSATALGAGALNIGAGTTIDTPSGAIVLSNNNAQTWNGDFTFTGANALNLGTGAVTLANSLVVTGAASQLTVGGAIGDGGNSRSLTKAGAGTMVLGGSNTYGGLTTVTDGVLRISNSAGLGSTAAGTTQSGTSALELDGTAGALTIGAELLSISGGGITEQGALRNIAGDNTYDGAVTLAAQSRINSDSGTLTLSNAAAVTSEARTLVVGGAGNIAINGVVALGSGGVSKDGTGTLTLGGNNTYTGNTSVSTGVLNMTGTLTGNGTPTAGSNLLYGVAAGNSVVNVSGNVTNYFRFQGSTNASANAAYIQTGGTVNFTSTATTNPNNVVASAGYGYMEITGGSLKANGRFAPSNGSATTGVMYIGGSGTLDHTSGEWFLMTYSPASGGGRSMITVDTGGTLNRVGSTNPFGLNMDRSNGYAVLNIVGGSVLNSNQAITFGNGTGTGITGTTGILNLAAGTLQIGANMLSGNTSGSSNSASVNFAGGTLKAQAALTNAIPVSAVHQTFTTTMYGAIDNSGTSRDFVGGLTVDTNSFATTLANPLLAPTADGVGQSSLSITGGSGYIGAPMVQFTGGTLAAGGAPAAGYAVVSGGAVTEIVITAPGSYTVAPSVTLTGGGGTGASVTVGALVPNTGGGLTKINPGTLTLSGANTYTGSTVVNGGTLLLNSNAATTPTTSGVTVNAGGTLAFTSSSASTLDLTGKPLTLSGGTLNFDVGASGINDTITVQDFTLTANSALTFNSLGVLSEGNTYTLLTSVNPISNAGGFTLPSQTIGRVTLIPTINTNSITITASVDEGQWATDADGNWSVGANWTGYTPTTAGDAALFGSAITAPRTVSVDSPQIVSFLRFNNANAYTLGANGSSNLTLNNGSSSAVVSVTSGSHTIAENIALLSNASLTAASSTQLTVSGVISGASRSIDANGAGTVVLSGVNTYTGTTTVSNGTLTLSGARTGSSGAFNVGNLPGLNAVLNISAGSYALGGNAMNVGNIPTTAGTATVNQTGGAISFSSGNAVLVGQGTVGNQGVYNLSGGSITTFASASRGIMLGVNSNPTPGINSGGGTFNLSGTGVLNMTSASGGGGDALLEIGRSDTIANNTTNAFNQTAGTANVGILTLGGAASGSTGVNAALSLTGGTFTANQFTVLAAGASNTAAITIGGSALVTLPAFPTARGADSTTTLTLDSDTGSLTPLAASSSYMPSGSFTNAYLTANGAKLNVISGRDITIGQVLENANSQVGTLTKNGVGNLTLTGVNTYTGETIINAGTLTINEGSIAGSSNIVNSGTLAYVLSTNARTYANPITGFGSLTKSGTNTLTLSGTNTYTGGTTVSGGNLIISGSTNTTAGNVTLSSGATLTIATGGSLTTTGTFNMGGVTIGNNLVVQTGATFSAASINNAWGTSTTIDGTLTISGTWTVSTNRTTDTFAGSGTINLGDMTLGNATTGFNYTGLGSINVSGNVTVASNGASGAPFYTQSSGTLNAAGMLLGDNVTNTAGSRTFNLSGGRVNLGAGGIATTGTTTATRAVNLGAGTLGASANWSSSRAMTMTSATPGATINTLDSVDNTTARTITLSGVLSGTGGLNKAADGSLVLTAANTYTGPTNINGGTLQLGDGGTTGALAITSAITNNSNLTINRSNAVSQSASFATIAGTGTFTQAGTGVTTLNTANTYTGATRINAGTLNLGVAETAGTSGPLGNQLANAADTIVFGGGTLQYSAANTFDYSGRFSSAVNQAYRVDTNSQNVTWAGNLISSGGSLVKSGAGILTLSGTNGYSGVTTVSGGTVQISAANQLGDGSETNTITLSGGALRSSGGTYNLGANRDITMSSAATIQVDAGTLTVDGDIANGANALTLRGTGNIVISGVIGAGSTPSGGLTIGSNTATGQANVTLSGNNLFTGNVTLPAQNTNPNAVLTITNSGALGVGPKTLQSNGGGEIHLQNDITLASNISLTVSGNPTQNSVAVNRGVIYNDSGSNVINGNISISSGNGATLIESSSGLLTINGNMTATAADRQLRLRGNGDGVISGVIANGSTTTGLPLLKDAGTGTWTLSGNNTYTGATTVSVGTLALVGGSQASPITVSAGASLGFTLGSPTTSTSTFNLTNGTIKITGTPTLPSYTLITDSAGITGTPTLDAPIAGYSLVKVGNSLLLTNPQALYDAWTDATYVPPLTAKLKTDDQDGDGFINLMEYAFGTQPTVSSTASLSYTGGTLTSTGQPLLVKDAGVWYAVFGRRKDYLEAGLTYTVQFSSSLSLWVDGVSAPAVIATDGTIDAVRVPFPNFIESDNGPQKPTFFRVEVSSSF